MTTKYLIYTGIFLLFGACSNKAIYYNPDQKRSIYFNWDLSKYVSNVAPDTVFFSFAIYEEKEVEYRIPVKSMEVETDGGPDESSCSSLFEVSGERLF